MNASAILTRFDALDRALVAAGFPSTSAWWRETIGRFLLRGVRQLVARVGRRGGKSSTLCRLAVVLALYGEHRIPPGDVGVVAFISTTRDEASARLKTVRAILDALRITYRPIEGGIELTERPIAFRTFTASIAGVSGFTAIVAIADEVAKWRDADSGSNPAKEVLGSLRPTMATQPSARMILSSSPFSTLDAHAEAFERGDTDDQSVAFAPTWVANPTVTEDETHRLEPEDRMWRREYAAIPQSSASAAFDEALIDRAMRPVAPDATFAERVIIVDPSSGGGDEFTWCVAGYGAAAADDAERLLILTPPSQDRARGIRRPPRRRFLHLDHVDGIEGRFEHGAAVVERIAALAHRLHVRFVHGDQRESLMLAAEFARHRLSYTAHPWTSPSKTQAVEILRAWLRDDAIRLPRDERLRLQLLRFEERLTPGGYVTYGGRGRTKDDRAALLLTLAMVDAEGLLPGSPYQPPEPHRSIPAYIHV